MEDGGQLHNEKCQKRFILDMLKNNGRESKRESRTTSKCRAPCSEVVNLFAATISARFTPIFAPINVRIQLRLYPRAVVRYSMLVRTDGGGSTAVPPFTVPCSCLWFFFSDFWPLVLHPLACPSPRHFPLRNRLQWRAI